MIEKIMNYSYCVKRLRKFFNTFLSKSLSIREQQIAIQHEKMIASREKSKLKNKEYQLLIKDVFIGSIIKFNEPNNFDKRYGLVINKKHSSIKIIYFRNDEVIREVEEGMFEYYHINLNGLTEERLLNHITTIRCREEWEILSREVVFNGNDKPYTSLKEYLTEFIENDSDLQKTYHNAQCKIMKLLIEYIY